MPKLTRKTATVELADGTIHADIRIINPDVLLYGETATRHKWPSMTVKNEVGTVPHVDYEDTFTAWAALRRLGLYEAGWDVFSKKDCLQVVVETVDVDPTQPDPEPDFESS